MTQFKHRLRSTLELSLVKASHVGSTRGVQAEDGGTREHPTGCWGAGEGFQPPLEFALHAG